jgi:hypothetical protein
MSRALLLAVIACAACRAPHAPRVGEFRAAPAYASLFKPYARWTYHAGTAALDETSGGPDETASAATIKCRVVSVKPFRGGITSHIKCDTPQQMVEDTGNLPLEGVWMANDAGLWHVHAGAAPSLDNATLVLESRPEEGRMSPDVLTSNDTFGEVAKDGDAWCTTHRQVMDGETFFTLCFAPEGVRSGRYGWKDQATHETRFELAR